MTWWEYIFGQGRDECQDDKDVTEMEVNIEANLFFETPLLTNNTATNDTATHAGFTLPLVNQKSLLGLANSIIVSA